MWTGQSNFMMVKISQSNLSNPTALSQPSQVQSLSSVQPHPASPTTPIRIIWIFWGQGWNEAPPITQIALQSWKLLNPSWDVIALDEGTLPQYIDSYEHLHHILEMSLFGFAGFSDMVRLHMLRKYGGVWVDSTTICVKPLDDWLFAAINDAGFFAFDRPGIDRLLSTWFLSSVYNDSYLITQWLNAAESYWTSRLKMHKYFGDGVFWDLYDWATRPRYFWVHDLFKNLYEHDSRFKKQYDEVHTISADGPHAIQSSEGGALKMPPNDRVIRIIDEGSVPVFKLTYKGDMGDIHWAADSQIWNTTVGYLVRKIRVHVESMDFWIKN